MRAESGMIAPDDSRQPPMLSMPWGFISRTLVVNRRWRPLWTPAAFSRFNSPISFATLIAIRRDGAVGWRPKLVRPTPPYSVTMIGRLNAGPHFVSANYLRHAGYVAT
jgi:hypothetical protein